MDPQKYMIHFPFYLPSLSVPFFYYSTILLTAVENILMFILNINWIKLIKLSLLHNPSKLSFKCFYLQHLSHFVLVHQNIILGLLHTHLFRSQLYNQPSELLNWTRSDLRAPNCQFLPWAKRFWLSNAYISPHNLEQSCFFALAKFRRTSFSSADVNNWSANKWKATIVRKLKTAQRIVGPFPKKQRQMHYQSHLSTGWTIHLRLHSKHQICLIGWQVRKQLHTPKYSLCVPVSIAPLSYDSVYFHEAHMPWNMLGDGCHNQQISRKL